MRAPAPKSRRFFRHTDGFREGRAGFHTQPLAHSPDALCVVGRDVMDRERDFAAATRGLRSVLFHMSGQVFNIVVVMVGLLRYSDASASRANALGYCRAQIFLVRLAVRRDQNQSPSRLLHHMHRPRAAFRETCRQAYESGVISDTSIASCARARSQARWRFIQYSGVVPKNRARRIAVSTLNAVSPLTRRSIRVRGTCRRCDKEMALKFSGRR